MPLVRRADAETATVRFLGPSRDFPGNQRARPDRTRPAGRQSEPLSRFYMSPVSTAVPLHNICSNYASFDYFLSLELKINL